jgi:hypothetical protein
MEEAHLHIVYLQSGMLLTKKTYRDWREKQDEFEDYKASFGPWPVSDVLDYLEFEYPADMTEGEKARIAQFIESERESIELFI